MSDNELLLQTLTNLQASLAALNVRLDKFSEESASHGEAIARLEERTERNVLGILLSVVGALAVGLVQAVDWFKGR